MSEWIEKKKAEVLALPLDPNTVTESLATDRAIKRKFYKKKHIEIDEITFESKVPQVRRGTRHFRLALACIRSKVC
jgi:hypothetical protein